MDRSSFELWPAKLKYTFPVTLNGFTTNDVSAYWKICARNGQVFFEFCTFVIPNGQPFEFGFVFDKNIEAVIYAVDYRAMPNTIRIRYWDGFSTYPKDVLVTMANYQDFQLVAQFLERKAIQGVLHTPSEMANYQF